MANNRNRNVVILALVFLMSFTSCVEEKKGKAKSKGKSMDVLVSSNASTLGNLSSTVLGLFERNQPYFIFGNEPYFNAIKVKLESLDGDFMYYRTIVILAHDKNKALIKKKFKINVDELKLSMKDGHMAVLKDPWAQPQHVILIYAKTEEELRSYFDENETKILNFTLDAQTKDLSQWYGESQATKDNYNVIKNALGVGVEIPANYKMVVPSAENLERGGNKVFIFVEDTENYTSTIMVHAYPYKDTSQFNEENLIAIRDTLGKKYIRGDLEGTYMVTASKDKYLRFQKTKYYNNNYVKELRGKWVVKGEFKAGPFINYSILDEKNQQIVMVEGFLMYLDSDKQKAPFLRTYESLPWSFR